MAFLLKGARVVDPQLNLDAVMDVRIDGETIDEVAATVKPQVGDIVIEAKGKVLTPGLVDMHVHFRDPGFEYKETIETGSRAAVHGGFTDVATMPNTNPVTDNGAAVRFQIDRGNEVGLIHVRPMGALTKGSKGQELAEIGNMVDEGASAFSDDGHGVQSAGMMRTVMEYVSQFDRVVAAHCEIESISAGGVVNEGRASTRLGMFGWPALGEEMEISRDIDLCRLTGCSLHICHISTGRGAELVRAAKKEGLSVTAEVCPHHLFLSEDDITDAYNTNLKMNPPLRTAEDTLALQAAVADGTVDCIVTDHAPHAAHEKDCEWEISYFGCIGLETSLPLMITNMVRTNKLSYTGFVRAMAVNPRRILRLEPVKIAAGYKADLTLFDPEKKVQITPEYFESKSKNSAFIGTELYGVATDVFVDGKRVLANEVIVPGGKSNATTWKCTGI